MKQFSTLENDLTMILELLADMVDTRHLTQKQMMHIMENYFNQPQEDQKALLPRKHVVKNIMNYSHSLEVMKAPGKQTMSVIAN
jgi:hypothetical protein